MKNYKWIERKNIKCKEKKEQYNFVKIHETHESIVGKIVLDKNNQWLYYLEDEWDYLDSNNLEDAKVEFVNLLKEGYFYQLQKYKEAIYQLEENLMLLSD